MSAHDGPTVEEIFDSSSDEEAFFDADEPEMEKVANVDDGESKADELLQERLKKQSEEVKEDVQLSAEEIEQRTAEAEDWKEKGNKLYQLKDFGSAEIHYSSGLDVAPQKSKIKAILYCNRAACAAALEDYKKVVDDTTACIEIDGSYSKAYYRRANAYRALKDFVAAKKDYEKVADLQGREAPSDVQRAIRDLAPLAKKQEEEEREKMMSELKGLGNKFLGLFGLSVDNFQATQDPATGSYSIQFNQNPAPSNSASKIDDS